MKGWQESVAVFGLFLVLTAVLTYPLVLHLPTAIADPGDPLLNSWTLAWDVHALLTDPLHLFDANIFHPHRLTLAYSDHLVGSALFAAPVFLATGNALLAHNVVLILSFPLSGLGMYYLARHLTGHRGASLIAGLIFAFAPYRFGPFGHLSHLPLLTAQWIPLTLLFLHRALAGGGRWADVLGFGGFFTLQGLSGGYYAYYLALTVAFVLGVGLWLWGRSVWRLVPRLAVGGVAAGLVLLPFVLPYVAVRREFGFVRTPDEVLAYSARPKSYLAAPAPNWLYGAATEAWRRPEAALFLGLVPVLLALYGVGSRHRVRALSPDVGLEPAGAEPSSDPPRSGPSPAGPRWLAVTLEAIVLLSLVIAVAGCIWGLDLRLGPLRMRSHSLWRPLALAAAAYGARWLVLGRPTPLASLEGVRRWLRPQPWPPIYAGLGLLAGLLSLGPAIQTEEGMGPALPYLCLYRELPGFDGFRVPARFAALVILSLAVLAAFGVARLVRQAERATWGHAVCGVIAAAITLEFASVPVPLGKMPAQPPAVYRWLAAQPGDFAVVELPFPSPSQAHWETRRLYYSTVHWKRLVNGYSGYFPPGYWTLAEQLQTFPAPEAVRRLRELGVRYALVHIAPDRDWWERAMTALAHPPEGLAVVARFEDAIVVEVRP